MRHFLRGVSMWVGAALAFGAASAALNARWVESHRPPVRPEVTTLVLGDSHAASALDPRVLPEAVNLARSAEPFTVTIHKLAFLEPSFPRLRRVVLTVAPGSLGGFQDRKLEGGLVTEALLERYMGVVPWRSLEGRPVPRETWAAAMLRRWWTPDRHLLSDVLGSDGPLERHGYTEGFRALETRSLLDAETLARRLERHFPPGVPLQSSIQRNALLGIARWARERGVALILVETPVHRGYREGVPEGAMVYYRTMLDELLRDPGVTWIDLSGLPVSDGEFADHDHVNALGAAKVSGELARHLSVGG